MIIIYYHHILSSYIIIMYGAVRQARPGGGTAVCVRVSEHIRVNMHGLVCATFVADESSTGLACPR